MALASGDTLGPLDLRALGVVGRGLDLEAAERAAVDLAERVLDLVALNVKFENESGNSSASGRAGNLERALLAIFAVSVGEDLASRKVADSAMISDENVELAVVVHRGPAGRDSGGTGEASDGKDSNLLDEHCRSGWMI